MGFWILLGYAIAVAWSRVRYSLQANSRGAGRLRRQRYGDLAASAFHFVQRVDLHHMGVAYLSGASGLPMAATNSAAPNDFL
jgi:hypothetical protein